MRESRIPTRAPILEKGREHSPVDPDHPWLDRP